MRKRKQLIAILLNVSLIATLFVYPINISAEAPAPPNIAMADAILYGNRQFVKNSLLNDDFQIIPMRYDTFC